MDFLRREYDYVLIDSSVACQDFKTSIIDQFDEIYIVSTPDVAALRDLARLVENLSLSESATSKLRVVVNRSTATDSITPDQIEKAVRFPISIAVPNNYFELLRAINDGEPIPPQRRSDFNQALARWANRIVHGIRSHGTASGKEGVAGLPALKAAAEHYRRIRGARNVRSIDVHDSAGAAGSHCRGARHAVLGDAARHALKTSVHHELIRRMDLEKLAAIQADDIGRTAASARRDSATDRQNKTLRSARLTAIAWRTTFSTRSSAWARWSRCCTIPR